MAKVIAAAVMVAMCVSFGAHAQQRVKKKGPADFEGIYKTLGEAWSEGSFGKASEAARELVKLINIKRTEAILGAMPPAPAGYTVVPQKRKNNAANNPLIGMAAAIGNVVTQKYRPDAGGRELQVTITADSPLVQMFKMWMTNPAALGPDAELIKYNAYDAVLKKQRKGWNLQILFGKDLAEIKVPDKDDEFTLGWISQKVVDDIAAALTK